MDETELYLYRKRLAVDFGLFAVEQHKARVTDPATSHAAALAIVPKSGTAKAKLLAAHRAHPEGLTDCEAAELAGLPLRSEYATRCSELQRAGFLEATDLVRPDPDTRTDRMVRRLTTLGREVTNG
jgi:hypothetical protein